MSSLDRSELRPIQPADEAVATKQRCHDEQCVRYTHEMPYDVKESVGRLIIRIVPLLYGGMFGTLLNDMPMALAVGAVVAAGMDIAMGDRSILRSVAGSLLRGGCPVVAFVAKGLAGLISSVGLNAPAILRNRRCGTS